MSRRHTPRPQGDSVLEGDPKAPDLEAELVSARYDLLLLREAFVAAWADDLGYGPGAMDYSRPRAAAADPAFGPLPIGMTRDRFDDEGRITTVGGSPQVPALAHQVGRALLLLAAAQHVYGDLPDGQTVWPVEPLGGRQVSLPEALQGIRVLDACLHQLQVHRRSLLGQEESLALEVAEGCRAALKAMPERLWKRDVVAKPKCLDCGRDVQDSARRCYACRQRLSRSGRARADRLAS